MQTFEDREKQGYQLRTQAAVGSTKVNLYAAEMTAGNWRWLPFNRQNSMIIDQAGKIMSSHHRLIAAQIVGIPVPEAALQRFPGITTRPTKLWRDVQVY